MAILTQQDAEKLARRPGRQRAKITGVNGASAICQTAQVDLWLPAEKWMSSTHCPLNDHKENILGFHVLSRRAWCLPNGSGWSFGSRINPNPNKHQEATVRFLHAAPALPDSQITNGPQDPISAAARAASSASHSSFGKTTHSFQNPLPM